jgi:hypothetical protein
MPFQTSVYLSATIYLYMKRGKIPKILRGYFNAKINDLKEGFLWKEAFFHPSNGFLISAFYLVSCINNSFFCSKIVNDELTQRANLTFFEGINIRRIWLNAT